MSGLTEESTAVQVGRLLGADVIVIATLQNIGEVTYLHLKILSVVTGEILDSTIAETDSVNDLRNLCLTAVQTFF